MITLQLKTQSEKYWHFLTSRGRVVEVPKKDCATPTLAYKSAMRKTLC